MSLLPPIFRRGEEVIKPLGPAINQPARRVLVQHAPGWSQEARTTVYGNAKAVPSSNVTYCVSAGVSAKELRETIVRAPRLPIKAWS